MTQEQKPRTFNPNDHLMQLKSREGSKDYLPVQWRLVWFRELCPQGTIDTEEMEVDTEKEVSVETSVWNPEKRRSEKVMKIAKGYARFRAVVTDGKGGRATGTKSECRASFDDYIEKAETGSIGRALAALGYGTQFAPELDEHERLVDSPIESIASADEIVRGQINAPLPSELRVRAKELGKDFDSVVKFLFKKGIPDDELTPNDCQLIHVAFEKSAQIRAKVG
jgi:hypothetical protein